jgi:hypothetical protein
MRFPRMILGLVLGVAGTSGCQPQSSVIPGNQQVRVVASATSISVTPPTVHPGQIDLILDLPQGQTVDLVRSSPAPGATGPLTDADLARPAQNRDAEGFSHELMSVSCCGNVFHETLVPGKYAFIVPAAAGRPPAAIAVVNVQS